MTASRALFLILLLLCGMNLSSVYAGFGFSRQILHWPSFVGLGGVSREVHKQSGLEIEERSTIVPDIIEEAQRIDDTVAFNIAIVQHEVDKIFEASVQKIKECASWYKFPSRESASTQQHHHQHEERSISGDIHSRRDESNTYYKKTSGASTITSNFVRNAVREVGPSVVRIDCERDVSPLMSHLYSQDNQHSVHIAGSGVVASEEGHVLTNAHVVDNAKRLVVTFSDGRSYKASFVASDEFTDLAVIKVNPQQSPSPSSADHHHHHHCTSFTAARIGNSDTLCSGDWVMAVGCPVALDFSVTLGIVSSPKRSASEVGVPGLKGNYIQTDAALNSGNSGGPLINEWGEVIGINSMTRTNTEAIGFAIPVNKAMEIFNVLKSGQKPKHAYFGVSLSTITPDRSRINNDDPNTQRIPVVHGALITKIAPNSPTDGSGLRRNDVIVEINGELITSSGNCDDVLDKCVPGQICRVKVARGDSGRDFVVADIIPKDLRGIYEEMRGKRAATSRAPPIAHRT